MSPYKLEQFEKARILRLYLVRNWESKLTDYKTFEEKLTKTIKNEFINSALKENPDTLMLEWVDWLEGLALLDDLIK